LIISLFIGMTNDTTAGDNSSIHNNGTASSPALISNGDGDGDGDASKPRRVASERTPLLNFKQKRKDKQIDRYYDDQVRLLTSYHCDIDTVNHGKTAEENTEDDQKRRKKDEFLAKIVLVLNLVLLIVKIVAAAMSNSLSVISTVIESGVDLVSGVIIWVTSTAITHRDPYEYPRGRTKLEPLAVIFVSIVMGVANIQVIIQAITQIVEKNIAPEVDILTVSILAAGILLKIAFCFYCLREAKRSSSARVLAQDARNDVMTNFVALICAFVGARYWIYADPGGAILVSTWVAFNWFHTAAGQIPLISGKCAPPDYINRIIRISVEHDTRIQHLDTVLVYHYGNKFLTEVHVVMDKEMPLKDVHDILETLERKLESLDFIERAFVHPDYEFCHKPSEEHKVV